MKRKILFIALFIINCLYSYSQWIQTNGPYGNSNVLTVFEHDSNYFASTYLSGSFSKAFMESSWNLNSNIYFKTYTIKGDSLYTDAHYFSGGLSRDMGIQLFDLNNPGASPTTINPELTAQALIHTDTCLFGGNETKGFFKSSFDGSVLEYYNNGLPTDTIWTPWGTNYETNVTAIEMTDTYIFCGTNHGIYRNEISLNNWSEKSNGLSPGIVTFINEINDTLYTSIEEYLFCSVDDGNNWVQINSAPSKITSFQKEGNQMLISTSNDGIYNSNDNGLNWNSMNSGLTDLYVNFITKQNDVILCGTNSKGVFTYNDGTWLDNNSGMVCSFIRGITCTDSNLAVIEGEKVYLKRNSNYLDITPNITYDLFLNIDNMGDTIFVSDYYMQSNWPYIRQFYHYTFDNGTTWTEIGNLPYTTPAGNTGHCIHIENSRIYGFSGYKMFYSDDLCLSWTNISLPSQYCNAFNDFEVYNSQQYATTCGSGELLMLDNANNWILSNNGLPSFREPLNIAYCDDAIFTFVRVDGMYVSFDNGINWSYASYGLNLEDLGVRDHVNYYQNLFVSTEIGVYVTSNYGQNWYECNDGLKNLNTTALKIFHDTLYVGTNGNGVWGRAIEDINLTISEHQNAPSCFKIYPNPATEYFTIEQPVMKSYEVQIFDIIGRNVLSKSFIPNEKINIGNLNSGSYIVLLKSKENILAQKLMINK